MIVKFRLFAIFVSMIGLSAPVFAQTRLASPAPVIEEYAESYDLQTPAEIEKAAQDIQDLFKDAVDPKEIPEIERAAILDQYQYLDPKREVPSDLLQTAVVYFDRNKSKFPNQRYIGVIDYKPRSDNDRFFVIDMRTGQVEKHKTAHGWASDQNKDGYAERFSNVRNSGASSIGFARTAETYSGRFKRALRLDGISSTNSNLRSRAVVVHGWDGVHERQEIQGLSWGCPALDWSVKDGVIDKLKEGALVYMSVSQK